MTDLAISHPAPTRLKLSLPLLFGLFVYAVTLVRPSPLLGDPDTYWHVVIGNWILVHHAVPHQDLWSYTKRGAPFVPLEWLGEVIIAGLYDKLGWAGLAASAALAVAAAIALQLRVLLKNLAPAHALIAAALAWNLFLAHLLARPFIYAEPILVLWMGGLLAARSEDRAPSFHLLPLMVLWANLHASYLLGLGFAGLFAGEAVIAAPDKKARLREVRRWGLFCALAFAAALATPYGISGVLQPLKLLHMHYALSVISEWQSPNFEQYQPLELWILLVFGTALARGWRLPVTRLLMVLFLLHMALSHARNVELLGLLAPLLAAPALGAQLAGAGSRLLSFPRFDRALTALAEPASAAGRALAACLVLVISVALLLPHPIDRDKDKVTPAAALAAVEAHGVTGPVFNGYDFGGYLIFRGIKTFIDGRADFYGDRFLKRYIDAVDLRKDSLPRILAEYGITWTLLPPNAPAVVFLKHLPGWRQLYADKTAVVDVRTDALKR